MLMLEIKFWRVDLFICFFLFMVLIKIVVFFNCLVKLDKLCFKDLFIVDLGFSIILRLDI